MKKYNEEIIKNVIDTIKECVNNNDLLIDISSNLRDDLNVDSVDAICFIMDLEEIYDITIDDDVIESLITVESIVALIEEKLNSGN